MIVLNTHKAATDLLEKRASIYSDRPRHIVASELMSGELLLGFMHFDDRYKVSMLVFIFREINSVTGLGGSAFAKLLMSKS